MIITRFFYLGFGDKLFLGALNKCFKSYFRKIHILETFYFAHKGYTTLLRKDPLN
jgi:hypothetical protein